MANEITMNIQFPLVPESLPPELIEYLTELQRVLQDHFAGDIYVIGDLHVDGNIFAKDEAGVHKKLYDQTTGQLGD